MIEEKPQGKEGRGNQDTTRRRRPSNRKGSNKVVERGLNNSTGISRVSLNQPPLRSPSTTPPPIVIIKCPLTIRTPYLILLAPSSAHVRPPKTALRTPSAPTSSSPDHRYFFTTSCLPTQIMPPGPPAVGNLQYSRGTSTPR